MSTFKDIHCIGDVIIDGNLEVMGGKISIIPTISFASGISSLVSHSYYYPHLRMVVFSMRAERKSSYTFDGTTAGTTYVIATIPSQYAPVISVALTTYASIGSLDAMVQGAVTGDGEINLRMNGKTNPTYFYLAGSWVID